MTSPDPRVLANVLRDLCALAVPGPDDDPLAALDLFRAQFQILDSALSQGAPPPPGWRPKWNDRDAVRSLLSTLDSREREVLRYALIDAASVDNQATILETIRVTLAEHEPAIGVVFASLEYDDGCYLTECGTVLFTDGTTGELDFDFINETFTEEYGRVGSYFTLAVDLRTGTLDTADHSMASIWERLDVPEPLTNEWAVREHTHRDVARVTADNADDARAAAARRINGTATLPAGYEVVRLTASQAEQHQP